ncbi:MAG: TonB-dependent receptor [Pseudomonadota bacterium]
MRRGWALARCAGLSFLVQAGFAAAQGNESADQSEAVQNPQAEGQEMMVQPIIVLGEKIDRPFLETTTSVGVITSEDLERFPIFSLPDSFRRLANVRLLDGNGGNSAIQIRGLNADGVAEIANAQPLISYIIDGATQNTEGIRRGVRSTWDLKQVEVLRGPQSGLFGRAALAGAVVIESNDPTFFWEGAVKGRIGNNEQVGGAFMLSGPIIEDQVAFRFSGELQDEELDIEYADAANTFLRDDTFQNVRAKLLAEPEAVPGLSALFTFNYAFDAPGTPIVSGPDFFARTLVGDATFAENREAMVFNYIGDISYELTDGLVIRSLSSFINTDLEIRSAPTSTAFRRRDTRDGGDFTQELRLEIDDRDGTGVSGVFGGFFGDFDETIDSLIEADLGGGFITVTDGVFGDDTTTTAVYADLRYNFYGPWSVLGGLRYQRDRVRNSAFTESAFGDTVFAAEETFDVVLPKAGLSYEIDETQTISAVASRGYRAGFTENLVFTDVPNVVDPEFVWTYELAYRFVSADQRLTFGANAFFNDYSDQQITIFDPVFFPATSTFNAGDSKSFGAEFEGRYAFENGLELFGALGVLRTELDGITNPICDPSGGSCDGNEFPEAPTVTFSAGGFYQHHTGVFGSADVSYTGSYFTSGDINNTPELEVDSSVLVNASLGYEYEAVSANFYVKNLFNEDFLAGVFPGATEANIGASRRFGVEVQIGF